MSYGGDMTAAGSPTLARANRSPRNGTSVSRSSARARGASASGAEFIWKCYGVPPTGRAPRRPSGRVRSGKTGTAVRGDRRSSGRREVTEEAQWHGDESDEQGAGHPEPLDDSALSGEAYDWYQRGVQMLDSGNPAAATQLFLRAADRVPRSRSVLEALARAQFDAEQYREAAEAFRTLAESNPDDDYAQFGWGL